MANWQEERDEEIRRNNSLQLPPPADQPELEVIDDDYPEPEMPAGLAKVSHDA